MQNGRKVLLRMFSTNQVFLLTSLRINVVGFSTPDFAFAAQDFGGLVFSESLNLIERQQC